MKKYILTLLVSLMAISASAQLRTAYFMEGSYFRTDMNPALIPTRSYFNLPAIGGVGVGLNNNFISVSNFVYQKEGQLVTALDSRVPASEFLAKLPDVPTVAQSLNLNLLGVGFYTKKMFWNFGINARMNSEIATSKDLFRIAKNIGNGTYNLSSTSLDMSAYGEVYLGFCLPLTKYFRVGAKVKGLVGLLNVGAQLSEGDISVTPDAVTGTVRGKIRGSGLMVNPNYKPGSKYGEGDYDIMAEQLNLNNLKSGGLAVDLGAELRILDDHLKVSVGVIDLGFIKWSDASAAAADISADFGYRGVDFESGEVMTDMEASAIMASRESYVRRLNCTLNIGAEYNVLDNHIAFGLLSHTEFRQAHTISELTASVNFRLGRDFTTTFSHTFCGRNYPGIFGFALNAHPAGINLFLGMDYIETNYATYGEIPVPKNLKSFNFYFGLGFNLGKNKF